VINMASLVSTAGCKFYIGGVLSSTLADFTETSFNGQTWVEVDAWMTKGDLGDAAEEINTPLINRGRNVKQKGTFDAGTMENVFAWTPADPGQLAMIAASKTRNEYAFKVEYSDTPAVKSSVFTVSIASPGVVTWTAHGLPNGTKVTLATTGALPTGLVAATTYYVVNAATNTFNLALTKGGTAIVTSGSQSGVHTATTQPTPTIDYATGLVMGAPISGGGANDIQTIAATMSVSSNIVQVAALG
jgi:hypothetical protein